jgi:RNA polymerase sigma factor (sigma-70 family)
MEYQWSFDQYRPPPSVQNVIDQHILELERQLQHLDASAVSFQGRMARPANTQVYELTLVLTFSDSSLTATEKGREVRSLLRSGFDALIRDVRRHHGLGRDERQADAGSAPTDAGLDPEIDKGRLDQYMPRLSQYVQREISYYVATGEIMPDLVRIEDVVDETVMRALTEREAKPRSLGVDPWLITLAADVLTKHVQQIERRRDALGRQEESVEQKLSRVPPEQVGSAIEDEMYQWYQPDENLHLEDVLADPHMRSPEEIAATEQLQQDLNRMIAFLPKRWRDVFVLHNVEDFTLQEISIVMGQTLDQVQEDLEAAQEFLQERLMPTRSRAHSTHRGGIPG